MKRSRRSLRGRLLIAMASIAVGVLVVTGVTTLALARRSAERTAIAHLEGQAPDVAEQLRNLGRALRTRTTEGRPTVGIGRLVTSVLRVTGGTMITVNADGTITEGVSGLAGTDAFGADRPLPSRRDGTSATTAGPNAADPNARGRQRLRDRLRNLGSAPPGPVPAASAPLPAGLTVEDFDAARLRAGDSQTGTASGRVFVAQPLSTGSPSTPVLVLTERIDSAAVNRARGFFLIGGALALIAAFVVSYFLARRLTRPLAVMGSTAAAIAAGDLTARVDLGAHPDDELADLAKTLNGMALQLDAARQSDRAFLLSVSHDLRTPLTSIRGYAEALTDGTIPASAEQQRAASVIAAEADRLERLVADLLDLARLDAHQFSLAPRPFEVVATVTTAVAAFQPAATDLGIDLHVAESEPIEGVGDPERVAQIVANLVENALKYARSRIDVGVSAVSAHEVAIRVADDGPGIDPAETTRVFERLFVSRSVPGRSVGTGLGLAIVGELSAAMGGRASVDATVAGGAFVVTVPLRADPAAPTP